MKHLPAFLLSIFLLLANSVQAADTLVMEPASKANGKHIVLVAGDEEYRTEESMPMLAKILSQKHGFKCTVVFSFGPDGADYIDPNNQRGLRGLEALGSADLMLIGTRFRQPDEDQAVHITKFLNAGKPVIGIRTATHAFTGDGHFGSIPYGQFGRKILGEQWVSHHGKHKREGCRAVIEKSKAEHAILHGVEDIFAPSDVYGVIHLTDKDQVLMRGAITKTLDPKSEILDDKRNDPMMPLAWLHSYDSPDGKNDGLSFCTTAGASVDFLSEDLRRLVVNAAYFLTDQEVPEEADVAFVDKFEPSFYGFIKDKSYWPDTNLKLDDLELGASRKMADPKNSPEWRSLLLAP